MPVMPFEKIIFSFHPAQKIPYCQARDCRPEFLFMALSDRLPHLINKRMILGDILIKAK